MARRTDRAEIVAALELRYDHLSARNVLAEAVAAARLGDKDDYTVEELSRLAWVLHARGERAAPASEALLELATRASSAGAPVFAEEATELDDEPEWERIETSEIPALVQGVVQAAMELARVRRGWGKGRSERPDGDGRGGGTKGNAEGDIGDGGDVC